MCEMHDMTKPDTEDCFKLLKLADGGDKYVLTSTERGNYTVSVKLPDGKTCEHCVLRWHWNTGMETMFFFFRIKFNFYFFRQQLGAMR